MFGNRQGIGIDCSDNVWRVVALRAAGASYEVTYAASFTPHTELTGDAAASLALMLRAAGQARQQVAGSLPASQCAFKTASLPPGKPEDLAQVVQFEAENQFPLPLQDVDLGVPLLPEPSGRQHAVIVGARRTLIDEQLALLHEAGATPVTLLPAPLAAANALGKREGVYVVVSAGAAWSDLCLYDAERLLGCRSVLAGSPTAEEWAERIARELRPWIVGAEELRRICLLGLGMPENVEALAQTTGLPVSVENPWLGVRDPHGLAAKLAERPATFATAIGLAKAALKGRQGLNLFPEELKTASLQQRKLVWVQIGLLCAILLMLLPASSGNHMLQARWGELRQWQHKVASERRQLGPEPGPALADAQQLVLSLHNAGSRPLEVLRALSAQLPAGITLTDFTYQREKAVVLQGHADSNSLLASATAVIDRTAVFDNVMLNFSTQAKSEALAAKNAVSLAKGNAGHGYDFQMTCTLPVGGDPTLGTGKQTRMAPSNKRTVAR